MTVCIAAIANGGENIVSVSDSKVAFGITSADKAAVKNIPLAYRHTIMIAGNDIAKAGQVIARAKAMLGQQQSQPTSDEIANAVFDECVAERDKVIEASVLRKRGYNWQEFRRKGKDLCPEATYYDLQTEMAGVDLSLDCLIAGFGKDDKAHLRLTNWKTPPEDYDLIGFYAIGSGNHAAISSLSHAIEYLNLTPHKSVEEVLYHVMAAKFMAESAQDVGEDTFAVILPQPLFLTPMGGDEFVRAQWRKQGAPRLPRGITAALSELLGNAEHHVQQENIEKAAKYCPRARQFLRTAEKLAKRKGAKTSS